MVKRPPRTHGLRSGRYRNDDVEQPKQREGTDLYAPLSPEEFADLVAFAEQFGDTRVLDKPMRQFRHLKRLIELGFIDRDENGSLYVAPFGRMRIAQGH